MSDPSANSGGRRIAVVMAGGSGERFWPVSTPTRPKQLLRLTGTERTMIEEAVYRLVPLVGQAAVYVSTTAELARPIAQSGVVEPEQILAEPLRRNTLGALVWVVASLLARGESVATVAIVTADHAIGEVDRFSATVGAAMDAAELTGGLVTIGVTPNRPETGYGYVERNESNGVALPGGRLAYAARSFREKPDLQTAELYVRSGRFLWNAGMFFFTVDGFRKALSAAQPEAAAVLDAVARHLSIDDLEGAKENFARLESISFDYAVMEKAETVHVVPSDFPWDDVGAWDAIARTIPGDEGGNVLVGPAAAIDSQRCVVYNDSSEIAVGICGLEDVVVVVTEKGVLVCRKDDVQRVRDIGRAAQAALSKDA
jgi:mannose-1-phosphate guanylyltransferase